MYGTAFIVSRGDVRYPRDEEEAQSQPPAVDLRRLGRAESLPDGDLLEKTMWPEDSQGGNCHAPVQGREGSRWHLPGERRTSTLAEYGNSKGTSSHSQARWCPLRRLRCPTAQLTERDVLASKSSI